MLCIINILDRKQIYNLTRPSAIDLLRGGDFYDIRS